MSTPERERADFATEAETIGGVAVLHVKGELDLSTHEGFGEELRALVSKDRPILVDLSECDFVDSSGIRSLLLAQRAADEAGGSVSLAGAKPQVSRVLDITGVGSALPMHPGVDEALSALGSE